MSVILADDSHTVAEQSSSSSGGVPRYRAPRKCNFRGWLGWGGSSRVTSYESRATPPLSLRRSAINVENVVVRLWQSSAICLRANARSAFQRGLSAQTHTTLVIPAPGVPANMNMFAGWIMRE